MPSVSGGSHVYLMSSSARVQIWSDTCLCHSMTRRKTMKGTPMARGRRMARPTQAAPMGTVLAMHRQAPSLSGVRRASSQSRDTISKRRGEFSRCCPPTVSSTRCVPVVLIVKLYSYVKGTAPGWNPAGLSVPSDCSVGSRKERLRKSRCALSCTVRTMGSSCCAEAHISSLRLHDTPPLGIISTSRGARNAPPGHCMPLTHSRQSCVAPAAPALTRCGVSPSTARSGWYLPRGHRTHWSWDASSRTWVMMWPAGHSSRRYRPPSMTHLEPRVRARKTPPRQIPPTGHWKQPVRSE
mmetsp:Transcript_31302/g.72957  ORF Transcript_31302/g.72957 Transcript_31302/m.72957 type:complete len:296 (-) Transcript_31302:1016-1903(-)